jgi:HEAT repeat protein
MGTETERRVLELLRGGYSLSSERKREAVAELGLEGTRVLRGIAIGEIATEHPKTRLKAIAALGFDTIDRAASRRALAGLLRDREPQIALQAARAFEESSPAGHIQALTDLVTATDTSPPVALAAARVLAKYGGAETIPKLLDLRARLLALVHDNPLSPSILALDRLVAIARGAPQDEDQRPKVV